MISNETLKTSENTTLTSLRISYQQLASIFSTPEGEPNFILHLRNYKFLSPKSEINYSNGKINIWYSPSEIAKILHYYQQFQINITSQNNPYSFSSSYHGFLSENEYQQITQAPWFENIEERFKDNFPDYQTREAHPLVFLIKNHVRTDIIPNSSSCFRSKFKKSRT